ncbi:MAG: ATP-binding protein [Prevotella sp.]|nr:ATP-binding protein [Candidatus Equicola faecalis]
MEKRFEPIKDKTALIIEAIMDSPDIPDDDALTFKIRLAVEEAVENVVQYAYAEGQGWIVVGTEQKNGILSITIRDEGVPFNPLDKDDPDITLSAEDRQIGGLGIFLCKQLMDKVTYTFENKCNILRMEKQLNN